MASALSFIELTTRGIKSFYHIIFSPVFSLSKNNLAPAFINIKSLFSRKISSLYVYNKNYLNLISYFFSIFSYESGEVVQKAGEKHSIYTFVRVKFIQFIQILYSFKNKICQGVQFLVKMLVIVRKFFLAIVLGVISRYNSIIINLVLCFTFIKEYLMKWKYLNKLFSYLSCITSYLIVSSPSETCSKEMYSGFILGYNSLTIIISLLLFSTTVISNSIFGNIPESQVLLSERVQGEEDQYPNYPDYTHLAIISSNESSKIQIIVGTREVIEIDTKTLGMIRDIQSTIEELEASDERFEEHIWLKKNGLGKVQMSFPDRLEYCNISSQSSQIDLTEESLEEILSNFPSPVREASPVAPSVSGSSTPDSSGSENLEVVQGSVNTVTVINITPVFEEAENPVQPIQHADQSAMTDISDLSHAREYVQAPGTLDLRLRLSMPVTEGEQEPVQRTNINSSPTSAHIAEVIPYSLVRPYSPLILDSPVRLDSPVILDSPVRPDSPVIPDSPVRPDSPVIPDSPVRLDSPVRRVEDVTDSDNPESVYSDSRSIWPNESVVSAIRLSNSPDISAPHEEPEEIRTSTSNIVGRVSLTIHPSPLSGGEGTRFILIPHLNGFEVRDQIIQTEITELSVRVQPEEIPVSSISTQTDTEVSGTGIQTDTVVYSEAIIQTETDSDENSEYYHDIIDDYAKSSSVSEVAENRWLNPVFPRPELSIDGVSNIGED